MTALLSQAAYRLRLALAATKRFTRLIVFGFERFVLVRLFERHRALAETITTALLHAKAIDLHPPELAVSDAEGEIQSWTHGFSSVNATLFLNLRNADALSGFRHAIPAPPFRAVYLWDSAFIAQVWKWWDADVAWEVLASVLALRDGDRLQHFVSEFARSSLTQPPLIAWSLEELGRVVDADVYRGWLGAAYPALAAYHRWLYAHRRFENGLFFWAHPYESGVENAPRFSTRDERRFADTRQLAAPDFSAYVMLQCECLARMARTLGRDEDARHYDEQAGALRAAMNELLWDETEGLYFDRHVETGALIGSRTIASLLPLWAGAPDRRRACRMHAVILERQAFNTVIPLPSVAMDDRSFERDMWRGPVWVNTAYAVIQGLQRYGFHATAADFAYRLCDGVFKTFLNTGRFFEFYDPTAYDAKQLHRKRGNRFKQITLGSKPVAEFVGWTGLVNTLVIDALFGLRRGRDGLSIKPRFPDAASGRSFVLTLPREEAVIALAVGEHGRVEGEVRAPGGARAVCAAFGERVALVGGGAALTGASR